MNSMCIGYSGCTGDVAAGMCGTTLVPVETGDGCDGVKNCQEPQILNGPTIEIEPDLGSVGFLDNFQKAPDVQRAVFAFRFEAMPRSRAFASSRRCFGDNKKFSCALKIIFLCIMLHSCFGDYSIDLFGDYQITRIYGDTFVLVHRPGSEGVGKIVIGPSVHLYGISNGLIFGHVEFREGDSNFSSSDAGYFVVCTPDASIKKGLTRDQWLSVLSTLGVKDEPELKKPSRSMM